jgi:hypothetical protein
MIAIAACFESMDFLGIIFQTIEACFDAELLLTTYYCSSLFLMLITVNKAAVSTAPSCQSQVGDGRTD